MNPATNSGRHKFLVAAIDHSHAGFFSYVSYAINHVIHAQKLGLEPVVYFGETSGDGPNAFFDGTHGPNMWDYYFEPVGQFTHCQLQAKISDPDDPLGEDALLRLNKHQLQLLHSRDPDSIFTYPYGIQVAQFYCNENWYEEQRDKARRIVRRFIRPKPHVLEIANRFTAEHFGAGPVLGIHMRGTDKGAANSPPELMRVVPPAEYFAHIDAYSAKHGACAIFVATDQSQYLDEMRARYGRRIISCDAIRASGWQNPFERPGNAGYKLGEDVLVDALLLSRCDYLLKCTSAVGEYAMYFNENLDCTDLNLSSAPLDKTQERRIVRKRKFYEHYLKWKKRGRKLFSPRNETTNRPEHFHRLQAHSGFGDRLFDLWAATTISRLIDNRSQLAVKWQKGRRYASFKSTYSTRLFSIPGCEFVPFGPIGASKTSGKFSHSQTNDAGYKELAGGIRQIILRNGMTYGTSNPEGLHRDLAFYGIDKDVGLDTIIAEFRAIAASTTPAPRIVDSIPMDISRRVGVHIRLSDKLVENERDFDMTRTTWEAIEENAKQHLRACVEADIPLFVCSEDTAYMRQLMEEISDLGGDIVVAQPQERHMKHAGYSDLVDFFALSRCRYIVQMTKYSTFSMAAAMIGQVPLVNFFPPKGEAGNRADLWRKTLPQYVEGAADQNGLLRLIELAGRSRG